MRSRQSLEGVAHQIGVMVAIERNRRRLTQNELARAVGINQVDVSALENGERLPASVTDQRIRNLFRKLNLPQAGLQAKFVQWWRDNAPR